MNKNIPKKANTARGVQALLRAGDVGSYGAGDGLYLHVTGHNKGSWVYRYQIKGKRRRIGLGSVEFVSLSDARIKLLELRHLVYKGIDPLAHKEQEELAELRDRITFDEVAADYIESQRSSWKSDKHAQQWENTLATYASPIIGDLTPAEITTEHLLDVLRPIWDEKNETASRLRNRIELVLNSAKSRNLREGENVATWRGHLDLLLAKHKKNKRRHHPALDWERANSLWTALEKEQDVGSQALQLTLLTALRTNEVLGAHWSEFNLESQVWVVPAERMKMDKDHRVPLSSAARVLLSTIPRVNSGLLFEGRSAGKQASNMVMLMKIRRMDEAKFSKDGIGWRDNNGEVITPHGLRSTFRDWAAENTNIENFVVEQALAHTISSAVEAAYRRGDLFQRRSELMEAWGAYVTLKTKSN